MLAVIATLPLMDLEVFRIAGRSIVLPYVAVGGLGLIVLRHAGLLRDFLYRDRAVPFLLGWFLCAGLTSVLAVLRWPIPGLPGATAAQLASLGLMVAHYVIFGAALRGLTTDGLSTAVRMFVVTAVAASLLTYYQVASVVFDLPYVDLLRTSNLYHHIDTLNWHGGGSWIAAPRAYGAAPEPTFWAGFLTVSLAFALGQVSGAVRSWVAPVLIAAAIVCTFARSVVPALGVLLACAALTLVDRRVVYVLGPGVVFLAFGATIWPALVSDASLTMLSDHSAIERLSSTVTGLRIVADYPFWGIGVGSVPFMVDRYLYVIEGRAGIGFLHLYSFLAHVLATTGLVGALLFGAFMVETARGLAPVVAGARPPLRRDAMSVFFAFVCLTIYWVGTAAFNLSFLWFSLAMASAFSVTRESR